MDFDHFRNFWRGAFLVIRTQNLCLTRELILKKFQKLISWKVTFLCILWKLSIWHAYSVSSCPIKIYISVNIYSSCEFFVAGAEFLGPRLPRNRLFFFCSDKFTLKFSHSRFNEIYLAFTLCLSVCLSCLPYSILMCPCPCLTALVFCMILSAAGVPFLQTHFTRNSSLCR